jgi:dTDP-4-dehydrorhamnose 3,5-epimerase
MKATETKIKGVFIIEPTLFRDDRGYFYESFNLRKFKELTGSDLDFVQDNQSQSNRGTLRGLHFQEDPHAQGKLVRVVQGAVLDVVVDIRKSSPTYGEYISEVLETHHHRMLWLPPGMAHGFVALRENTIFAYKCTDYYHKDSEKCIAWNDPDLNIDWGFDSPLVSDKDKQGMLFKNI